MPDSVESRLGRLEVADAQKTERVNSLTERIGALGRTVDLVITHGEALVEMRGELKALKAEIAALRRAFEESEVARRKAEDTRQSDRRADRRLWFALAGGIIAAVVTGLAGIVAAGVHP